MPSNTSKAPASSNASHDMLIPTAFLGYHTTTVTDSAASTAPHATSVLTSASDPIYSTTCATINICTSTDNGAVGSVGAMNNNTTITDLIGPNSSDDIDTSVDADIITAPHATSVSTSASDPISSTTCATINIRTSTDDGTIGSVGAMNNNATITDLIGPNSSDDIGTSVDAVIIGAISDDGNIEDLASPPP
jgi:hypothetical protein